MSQDQPAYPAEPDPAAVANPPEGGSPTIADLLNTTRIKKKRFLKAFSETAIVADGCHAAKVTRKTVFKWCETDLRFRERFILAQEDGADRVEKELYDRAMNGVERRKYDPKTGALIDSWMEKSDTLLVFLLKGMRPMKYKERVDGDVKDTLGRIHEELQRLGVTREQNRREIEGESRVLKVEDALLLEAPAPASASEPTLPNPPPPPAEESVVGCTWVDCAAPGTQPQEAPDGQWAILCDPHHQELGAAIAGGVPAPLVACWIKAQGGAQKAAARMLGTSAAPDGD